MKKSIRRFIPVLMGIFCLTLCIMMAAGAEPATEGTGEENTYSGMDVSVPSSAAAGEPLEIFFARALTDDENFRGELWPEGADYPSRYYYLWEELESEDDYRYTLERYGLDAGNYTIKITFSKTNYEAVEVSYPLTVTGSRPGAPEISLPSTTYDQPSAVPVTITAAGLERVVYGYDPAEYLAQGAKQQLPGTSVIVSSFGSGR